MYCKRLFSSLAALAMLLAGPAQGAEAVDAAMISNTCAGCHGVNGVSEGQAPSIAGLSREYLRATMLRYKEGTRYSTIMGRIARGYSEAEIEAMAEFFASQSWVAAEQRTDPELVALGQQLHTDEHCDSCHGAVGTAVIPIIPHMAGQYVDYLYFQMLDYINPDVATPISALSMVPVLKTLSDEEIRALAHFYAANK